MKNWRLEEKNRVKFYRIKPLPGLNLVFTTRIKGWSKGNYHSLNLSYDVGDDPRFVDRNYRRVKKALGVTKIFTLKQVHSNKVFYVNPALYGLPAETKGGVNSNNFKEDLEGDGLFTDEKGLAIGVKVADCLPIYIFDKKYKVIGIAHAGWRSTLAQIGKNLVNAITEKFSLSPSDLNFALGPCIDQTCYEAGFELLSKFFNNLPGSERFFVELNRKIYFDLRGLNRFQLKEFGLNEIAGLDNCPKCTSDLFYSARRDGTSGRNLALIYLSTK